MAVLVLTEKPSVAQAIAAALGIKGKKDGYIEGDGYIISWCVGHLVELANADCYDARYSKWTKGDLPILPAPWKFTVSPGTKKQFGIIKSLMERSDVSELIEATDAGREGELIFRLVYQEAGCKKPFKRLWISSMEDSAIRAGFENLIPGEKYDVLYEAALCRAKADWLVGINGTRLFSTIYRGPTMNVGRVMTPTLAMIVEREKAITEFQKEKFYVLELDCGSFKAAGRKFSGKTEAEKARKSCFGRAVTVKSVSRQEKTEKPPKLYDLTTLQREANRLYGYTAQQTLDYVQSLYEKKLATYPRTDSRYLTKDMAAGLPGLCGSISGVFPFMEKFSGAVDALQVVDDSRVSDHHAVIPTKEISRDKVSGLPTGERNVLSMISVRLLCAVCPEKFVYADTAATLICGTEEFTAKGRVELAEGWKALERAFLKTLKEKQKREAAVPLPNLEEGKGAGVKEICLREGATSAPSRFTEDSLLSAMENADAEGFARIEDAEHKGLGTPATRAGIIEKLVRCGFAERNKKQLIPTKRGMELIKVLPDKVKSAKLTAEWEAALKEVERGECSAENFMNDITDMVRELVKEYENVEPDANFFGDAREEIGKCPRCGRPVYEGKKNFYCSGYKGNPACGFVLWKENPYFKSKRKELTKAVAKAFLKDGKAGMKGLYSEKKGKTYDATIVMEDTGEKYVKFKLEFPQKKQPKEKME